LPDRRSGRKPDALAQGASRKQFGLRGEPVHPPDCRPSRHAAALADEISEQDAAPREALALAAPPDVEPG